MNVTREKTRLRKKKESNTTAHSSKTSDGSTTGNHGYNSPSNKTGPGVFHSTGPGLGLSGPEEETGGVPLSEETRYRMEPRFGTDFSNVRVHTGPSAHRLNRELRSKAFTYGDQIYFGPGRYNPGTHAGNRLLAHELTHVVQQGGKSSPVVQRDGFFEDLGESVAGAAAGAWEATGGRALDAAGELIWDFVESRAPTLASILREVEEKGFFGFLRERISGAVTGVFDRLSADNETAAGVIQVFNRLVAQAAGILGPLASGDCEPLLAAVEQLKETVSSMAGEAWEAVTDFFRPVGDFFSDLWESFGAPFVQWIQDAAGDLWEYIQGLGRQIWDWMSPVRDAFGSAWDWIKDMLGIGESEGNDQGGLVQWIKDKAAEVWDAVKEVLAPVIEPIRQVVEKVRAVLPLDAILNLRETITGWLDNVSSMADSMNEEEGVVEQQTSLRDDILPGVLRTVQQLREGIVGAGQWVSTQIGAVGETVRGMFTSIQSNSILGGAANLIQWLPDKVAELTQWAQSTVTQTFGFVGDGLVYLSQFIEPVLDTLIKVFEVLGDLAGRLSELVLGPFLIIPKCIREPIKNFVIEQILSHIPIFSQLMEAPDAWARVQETAMRILRQVFVDGNLVRAAWTFFSAILRLFNIPPELVTGIVSKAARAIGSILRDPVGFLINLVRALKEGFVNFCSNIGTHLLTGVTDWLFGHMRDAGITPPSDFSLSSVLDFVLQVLDITMERIFQRMERHPRIGPERVARLREMMNRLTGAWEWVSVLIKEGPGGLWRMLQERLSDLWGQVRDAVIGWISQVVITRATAKLALMADPSGIGGTVITLLTIYQAIQTFAEHIREMMETINSFLDGVNELAAGAISAAAGFLESALARIIPIAIGFLAKWAGLGNLGTRIRETVEDIRERVDGAIDWLIERGIQVLDAVISGVQAVAGAVRSGVESVMQWWNERRGFSTSDGRSHTVFFAGEGAAATLRVRSTERPLDAYIAALRGNIDVEAHGETLNNITRLQNEINTLRTRTVQHSTGSTEERLAQPGQQSGQEISEKLGELAGELAKLPDPGGQEGESLVMPPSRITTRETKTTDDARAGLTAPSVDGEVVEIKPLSIDPGGNAGSAASHYSSLYNAVNRRQGTYVAGHLLSAHIYGPGHEAWNLTPITGTANNNMSSSVENPIHDLIFSQNKVLRYKITAHYPDSPVPGPHIAAEGFLPTSLSFELKALKLKESVEQAANQLPPDRRADALNTARRSPDNWEDDNAASVTSPRTVTSTPPLNVQPNIPNLNTTTRAQIIQNTGVTQTFAEAVVNYSRQNPFEDLPEFQAKMSNAAETGILVLNRPDSWKQEQKTRLDGYLSAPENANSFIRDAREKSQYQFGAMLPTERQFSDFIHGIAGRSSDIPSFRSTLNAELQTTDFSRYAPDQSNINGNAAKMTAKLNDNLTWKET